MNCPFSQCEDLLMPCASGSGQSFQIRFNGAGFVCNRSSHSCPPVQILRALPFFSNVPEALFDEIVAAGELVTYHAGEVIWTPTSAKDRAAAECAWLTTRGSTDLACNTGFAVPDMDRGPSHCP